MLNLMQSSIHLEVLRPWSCCCSRQRSQSNTALRHHTSQCMVTAWPADLLRGVLLERDGRSAASQKGMNWWARSCTSDVASSQPSRARVTKLYSSAGLLTNQQNRYICLPWGSHAGTGPIISKISVPALTYYSTSAPADHQASGQLREPAQQ